MPSVRRAQDIIRDRAADAETLPQKLSPRQLFVPIPPAQLQIMPEFAKCAGGRAQGEHYAPTLQEQQTSESLSRGPVVTEMKCNGNRQLLS